MTLPEGADYSLTESALIPFQAEPTQLQLLVLPSIRAYCLRRVYPGAGETFEVVLFDRLHLSRVDRMQRNFEPMRKQVEARQGRELTDVTARMVIYEAFVEAKLEAPKHQAGTVHDLYFEPKYDFDGVEIHAANGYLLDQFLRDGSNQRHGKTDQFRIFASLAGLLTHDSLENHPADHFPRVHLPLG